jgi:putative membrane protein
MLKQVLLVVGLFTFIWSGINPHDYFTWFLEIFPILIVIPILIASNRRFPLTNLLYVLVLVHSVILMIGGHYTYALVPVGDWVRDIFQLARNDYDRFGHFAQGFIPAIAAREILIRTSPLRPGAWLNFLTVCVCMAISVTYEFIEWWVALATGEAADSFLGSQGDVWDTQWDMFLATVGAISAILSLRGVHNRQIAALDAGVRP